MAQDLLTAQEAAELLKVKKATVYEMVKRGEIPAVKIGKQVRIDREDLQRLLQPAAGRKPQKKTVPAGNMILCGQDDCLDIIANHISVLPGAAHILRSHAGSYNGLHQLYLGRTDISAVHLWDPETQSYNLPYIPRMLPGLPAVAVRLVGQRAGIYTARGNPRRIEGISSLISGMLTMVNREKGSAARILLDAVLKEQDADGQKISGYERELSSHLAVAGAVARGEADFGIGSESAARQVSGVEFLPLQTEWYDLVFLKRRLEEPTFRMLMDYLTDGEFQDELAVSDCYDLSQTGQVFWL